MTRVLVAHAGKHGSTAEIAQAVADELGDCGIDAECRGAG
jgi:menaquinone-dependent protoporphyrinogen oxidase